MTMAKSAKVIIDRDIKLITKGIDAAEIKIARMLQQYARTNHRFINRTRNLMKSTYFRQQAKDIIKGFISGASYGKYIIEGHGSWEPDNYLEEAVDDNRDLIEKIFIQEIDKQLGI